MKRLSIALWGFLLSFSPNEELSAKTDESGQFVGLKYHGFELLNVKKDSLSTEDQIRSEGLEYIFTGRGFRIGIPIESVYFLGAYKAATDGLGSLVSGLIGGDYSFSYDSDLRYFQDLGKLPSPPNRKPTILQGIEHPAPDLMAGQYIYEGNVYRNTNCFMCHSGVVGGKIIAGLGNSHTDQVGYSSELALLLKAGPALKAQLQALRLTGSGGVNKKLEELEYYLEDMRSETQSVLSKAMVRGDNMGPFVVWKKISRLIDPSNSGLISYETSESSPFDYHFEREKMPPVDPNPWYLRKYSLKSYRYGEPARNIAAHFSLNFTKPTPYVNDYHEQHVADVAKILYYAENTQSPAWPGDLDAELVEEGRQLFHNELAAESGRMANCANCHGSYIPEIDVNKMKGWVVDYPVSPSLINVGTDQAYSEVLMSYEDLKEHASGFSDFFVNQELMPTIYTPSKEGYIAPALDGVWASAPYFHNGSVPTLYQVLNSAARARMWSRPDKDPFKYDYWEVGLYHEKKDMSKEDFQLWYDEVKDDPFSEDAKEFRRWYHTELYGRSNKGHQFGDHLNDKERYAIIEFLKSISGAGVRPKNKASKWFYGLSSSEDYTQ